jgi:hypothetical protein
MQAITRIIIFGAIAILAVDTVGSVVFADTGFPYIVFRYASFAIFAVVGVAAGRVAGRYLDVIAASGIVGLVDATLGMYISWEIGPGRMIGGSFPIMWLGVASGIVLLEALLIGLFANAVLTAINRLVGASRPKGSN